MSHAKNLSPRTLTTKGRITRTVLLEKAAEVFQDKGYYGASVSEISRRCELSQGTFYQYFRNKEQIFLELHDAITEKFQNNAGMIAVKGRDFRSRLGELIQFVFTHFRENRFFHHILGEFELIDSVTIGYYASLSRFIRGFFRREAEAGHIRSLDPDLLAYGLLGMASFHALDWGSESEQYETPRLVELAIDLLLYGIGGSKPWDKSREINLTAPRLENEVLEQSEENPTQGQLTRRAIFQTAEKVFGDVGLNHAGISEITRLAGVAQGTFYIHFKSKRDLMEGFVKYLSHEMRRELKMATAGVPDRRDSEREGMRAFYRFLQSHRKIYRVVPESETIGQEMAMWYYLKLEEGYTDGLAAGVERGEIRDLPIAFMARSLMGFNHMIGLKWLVWNSAPQAEFPQPLLDDAVALVLDGLCPPK